MTHFADQKSAVDLAHPHDLFRIGAAVFKKPHLLIEGE